MTDDQKSFYQQLEKIQAGDGDDYAEDVARGFEQALKQFR